MVDVAQHIDIEIDMQPVLEGNTLLLRPLRTDDFESLYAAAADPLIWEVHPEPTRYQRAVFENFFNTGVESRCALVIVDKATGHIIGSSRYYDWDPQQREIAIGYTFIARAYWGGQTNGELKQLMLRHIFQWADRVWFHIGKDNIRSRKALEKIGGVLSLIAPRDVNGCAVDYCYYQIARTPV